MKKIYFFVAALCATMMASAATTFDAPTIGDQGTANTGSEVTKTIGGVTLTLDKGYVYNDSKYEVNYVRAYAGSTMTISATSNISKIVVTTAEPSSATNDKYSAAGFTAEGYSVDAAKTVGTWTGSATSVTFSATKQVRIIKVEVTLGEGGETGDEDAIAISPLAYSEAPYMGEYEGQHEWNILLWKSLNDDYELVQFDILSSGATTIAGTYSLDEYSTVWFSETDSVIVESGTLTITCIDDAGNYTVVAEFVGNNGKKYTVNTTVEILAYDYETGDDIELTDVASTAIRQVEMMSDVYAHDGRIYAEEGARIYTVTGLDVTRMNGNLDGIYVVKNDNKVAKVVVRR